MTEAAPVRSVFLLSFQDSGGRLQDAPGQRGGRLQDSAVGGSTFDLYPGGGEGHGVQGQICDILRPHLAMNRFLPLWPHRFPQFGYIHLGGAGGGGL